MAQPEVRRRKGGEQRQSDSVDVKAEAPASASVKKQERSALVSISDLIMAVSLVFGGCCL